MTLEFFLLNMGYARPLSNNLFWFVVYTGEGPPGICPHGYPVCHHLHELLSPDGCARCQATPERPLAMDCLVLMGCAGTTHITDDAASSAGPHLELFAQINRTLSTLLRRFYCANPANRSLRPKSDAQSLPSLADHLGQATGRKGARQPGTLHPITNYTLQSTAAKRMKVPGSKDLGRLVRALRERLDLTQERFAAKLGVTFAIISAS
jgi:hypothetical protein